MIEIAKVRVTGANVRCNGSKIPRGMAGAYISVQYDSVWDNLVKTVVFKGSSTIDVVTNKNIIEVPHEVLQSVGKRVYIGFYGTAATGKVIIPTFWAELGTVVESTDPSGDESTDPALPVYAALTEQVGDLEEEQVNIKKAAESAKEAATEADKKAGNAKEQADNAIRNINTLREVVSKFHSNIVEKASGETIILDDASDMELAGLRIIGKTTQNGTPTPDAPVPLETVGADGSVDVTVCGKNLLRYPYRHKTFTTNGITFTDNGDGSVTANGTATANAHFDLDFTSTNLKPGHEYIASSTGDDSTSLHLNITYFKSDGTYANVCEWVRTPKHFTVPSDYVKTRAFLRILKGGTANNITAYPMLRHVSATDESYKSYAGHTLSISTPNGLPGIPVASGGNYTDESGQQWICDEVDFEKGVYVQRVVLAKLTSTMNWKYSSSTNRFYTVISNAKADYSYRQFIGLCSHYPAGVQDKNVAISYINEGNEGVAIRDESRFSGDMGAFKAWLDANDVWVLLQAKEQRETALSAEQLAAFALLHTNCPNTTIFNDENAGMEVKYVADTKLYIDKKFDQLAAAMLNN